MRNKEEERGKSMMKLIIQIKEIKRGKFKRYQVQRIKSHTMEPLSILLFVITMHA